MTLSYTSACIHVGVYTQDIDIGNYTSRKSDTEQFKWNLEWVWEMTDCNYCCRLVAILDV